MDATIETVPFSTKPIPGAAFGCEVTADLRKPMDAAGQAAFRALFFSEKLLVFRNQNLTFDDQLRVVGYCGTVLHDEDYRELSTEGNLGAIPLCFHSDLSFTTEPHDGLSLHALDVNDGETSTRFANGIQAWARLPEVVKSKIENRRALAIMSLIQSRRSLPVNPPASLPRAWHDVVKPHPFTGENILYITEMHTVHIEGLEEAENDALLEALFAQLYAPDNIYEHRWANGDLVIWDNLALQHGRPSLQGCTPRRLQRVTLASKSFNQLCPDIDYSSPEIQRWIAAVD
jgi:taurine dioxygenase